MPVLSVHAEIFGYKIYCWIPVSTGMTPGAKGEGAHNEPRRGSLGNEGGFQIQLG